MKRQSLPPGLAKRVIPWYKENARDLPFRRSPTPYHVWLSEIMLQQTRISAVIPYYTRFLARFPTVFALAEGELQEVLKLWEGLGYYSRAKNLLKAAQTVVREYGGVFPRTYKELLKLPGVGAYTAGAIASICFDEPVPALDGNVLRVLSRLGEVGDTHAAAVKKALHAELASLYPKEGSGLFTQGLMELGETVCLPKGAPLCGRCPLADVCLAHRCGTAGSYPTPKKKAGRRAERLTVLVLTQGGCTALVHRPSGGVLGGLWGLPVVSGHADDNAAKGEARRLGAQPERVLRAFAERHIFTHIEWDMRVFHIECTKGEGDLHWVSAQQLEQEYMLPTAFKKCLPPAPPGLAP